MSTPKLVAYAGLGSVGALYVDGKLDKVGSRQTIEARVAELVGLEIRTGDEWLRGSAADPAPTLASIDSWVAAKAAAQAEVERLRAEAQATLREAARLAEAYR